jgi:chromosome segregation ATPase
MKDKIAASKDFTNVIKDAKGHIADVSGSFDSVAKELKNQVSSSEELGKSLKGAVESVNKLSSESERSASIMAQSSKALDLSGLDDEKYKKELSKLTEKLSNLNSAYEQQMQTATTQNTVADKLNDTIEKFHTNLSSSSDNTQKLQEKVNALTKLYEAQIDYTAAQSESVNKLKDTLEVFLSKLNDSADKTVVFNDRLDDLAEKVSSLNNVYGNMLDAMGSRK